MDKKPYSMRPIAHIRSDFPEKFGIPHQSGVAGSLVSEVVMEKEYRSADAFRGLAEFSHLWLVWVFSETIRERFSPTVRPPRLGGNQRMGVFATRSPFRPNPIGLSSVRLIDIREDRELGPVLVVGGADLMDGTPILDIKPYIAGDLHADAAFGFTDQVPKRRLPVEFPGELLCQIPEEKRQALLEVLSGDPRPAYQKDPERIYGMPFAGWDIRFCVKDDILRVVGLTTPSNPRKMGGND